MLENFLELRQFVKWSRITTETFLFKTHRFTSLILLIFVIILTARICFEEQIRCYPPMAPDHGDYGEVMEDFPMYEQYCLMEGLYTFPNRQGLIGVDVVYPGVSTNNANASEEIRRHEYYLFVVMFFLAQVVCFALPHYLWKMKENGVMMRLIPPYEDDELPDIQDSESRNKLVKYFVSNLSCQNFYAYSYFFFEFLNLVNVSTQIYITNKFIGGGFWTYGMNVFFPAEYAPDPRDTIRSRIFPIMAKCTYYRFGPSGTMETHDISCLLPFNTMNKWFFCFLWYWFVILTVLTAISILYRVAFVMVPYVRLIRFKMAVKCFPPEKMKSILKVCDVGDSFTLLQLSKNIDSVVYKRFLKDLCSELSELGSGQHNA